MLMFFRKKLCALILVLFLAVILLPASMVKAQSAGSEPVVSFGLWHTSSDVIETPPQRMDHVTPVIEVVSPRNQTVFQTSRGVTITIDVASYFWIIDSVSCAADWWAGAQQIFGPQSDYVHSLNATITVTFNPVPVGQHAVDFSVTTNDGMHNYASVTFLSEGYWPAITVYSPWNQTYTSNNLAGNFSVDKPSSWAGYSLDGQANVTIYQAAALSSGVITNFTLANMTNGLHSLAVYANDTMGDMTASQPINFNIAVPTPSPTAKPATFPGQLAAISAAVVVAAVACASLAVYFKLRKDRARRANAPLKEAER